MTRYKKSNYDIVELRRLEYRFYNYAKLQNQKIFMFTSATTGEGKTTISSFLSVLLSHHRNKRTLIIDCDVYRPRIHKLFDLDLDKGLADYLDYQCSINEIIKNTWIPKLHVITSGTSNRPASDLITAEQIQVLLGVCRSNFDFIILDSPPILPVSDPLILADIVDGIYWVLLAGSTKRKVVKHALRLLGEKSDKIVGAIINNSKQSMPYYYNYSYHGYGDSEKSREKPREKPSPKKQHVL